MKKSTTHKFNVINIGEYHQPQGGGSVHADFSLLDQKWAERENFYSQLHCRHTRRAISPSKLVPILSNTYNGRYTKKHT